MVNRSLQDIQPSATLALNQKAKAMQVAGRKIFNFTAGEPDGDTPLPIQEAAIHAIKSGYTRYTNTAGIVELREAITIKAKRIYNRDYHADDVLVCNGGKQAIYNALYTLLNPEDEVIILTPAWVSYQAIVGLLGAKVVNVHAGIENAFVPNIEDIKAAITARTKLIILNSPCNPTGATYTQSFIDELMVLLNEHSHVSIMTDDIYEHYVFDHDFVSIASHPDCDQNRLIIINGVSKSHAMTGWRIGYVLANPHLVKIMKSVQSQMTSNACSISQHAALKAIQSEEAQGSVFKEAFAQRRDMIYACLSKIDGIDVLKPQGAFYIFPNFSKVLITAGSLPKDDVALSHFILEEEGVAMVPGSAFGAPGYMRLSYGLPNKDIQEGIEKLKSGLLKFMKTI